MRTLVIGASGFAGRHVVRALVDRGHDVMGTWHKIPHPALEAEVVFVQLDVLDRKRMAALVLDLQPQAILHLAATAAPTQMEEEPWQGFEANARGTLHVLLAATLIRRRPRVVIASSGEAYGPVHGRPHRETDPLRPAGFYGASKAAAEAIALAAGSRHGLEVVIARAFNHTGPGQAERYVCSRLARYAVLVSRAGFRRPVEMGNLDVRRDFMDVRDVAQAYALLIERGRPGEAYNICSGRARSIREIAGILSRSAGFAAPIRLRSKPALRRKGDLPLLAGSPAKIRRELGFRPRYPLRRTLHDLYEYWTEELALGVSE